MEIPTRNISLGDSSKACGLPANYQILGSRRHAVP